MAPSVNLPVILIHGFIDVPLLSGTFGEFENVLRNAVGSYNYLRVQIPPLGSVEERSNSAINQIAAKFRGKTVHLIGHSMGGINARDIAARVPKMSNPPFSVKTVTTVGTPHRGCKAIDFIPGKDGKDALMKTLRNVFGSDFGALGNLTAKFMDEFNAKTPNNSNVRYFSWAGYTRLPTPLFLLSHPVTRIFGDTDGVVNVSSAHWGTELGDFAGRDHVAILNSETIERTLPHLAAAEQNRSATIVPVENGLLTSGMRRIEGDLNGVKSVVTLPGRLIGSLFGL